jgi:AraC family transcriptional regulator
VKTDYLPAVQSAIDYIESHLQGELSSQEVAAHIGFSPYHFHRIFSAILGESVKDYVRKRRLMVAAETLSTDDVSILDLALQSGFDSQEAFTRAFKKMFGTTPGAYRKLGAAGSPIRKPIATYDLVRHLTRGITMQPTILKRGHELAIGMGDSFLPGQTELIGLLWQKFVPRMHEVKNRKPYDLGLCMSNHPQIPKKPGDTMVYVAAVPVENTDDVPSGMVVCELPESTYAKFTHKGKISDIKHTVQYIWGTWIPESGYKLREIADFELYDERFNPMTGEGEVDIYVPLDVADSNQ